MPKASSRWCPRCAAVHSGACPNKPAWQKPVHKKSGRGGRPWRRKREDVFERDGYLCQRHLRRGFHKLVTLHGAQSGVCDHIKPLAEGGTDGYENLETICQQCDREKTQAESTRGRVGSKV